jgi:hypothetical protein
MSRSFTKFLVAFVLVGGMLSSAVAQDENIIRPITKSGSAAFVFNVSGLGAFGPAAQPIATLEHPAASDQIIGGVGVKYYLSDDLAAKVLLAFNTADDGADSLGTSSMGYGIGAIIEMHFGPLYSTSPYAGGGIMFAGGSLTTDVANNDNDFVVSASALTIMAVAGFDWFFTRGIAVGAEWGLGYTMKSSSTESGGTSTDNDSPSGIALGMTGTSSGISGSGSVHAVVYF